MIYLIFFFQRSLKWSVLPFEMIIFYVTVLPCTTVDGRTPAPVDVGSLSH